MKHKYKLFINRAKEYSRVIWDMVCQGRIVGLNESIMNHYLVYLHKTGWDGKKFNLVDVRDYTYEDDIRGTLYLDKYLKTKAYAYDYIIEPVEELQNIRVVKDKNNTFYLLGTDKHQGQHCD